MQAHIRCWSWDLQQPRLKSNADLQHCPANTRICAGKVRRSRSSWSPLEWWNCTPASTPISFSTTASVTERPPVECPERPRQLNWSRPKWHHVSSTSTKGVYSAPETGNQNNTSDLAQYLMRREKVSSWLLKFIDQPENYWAGNASFPNSNSRSDLVFSRGAKSTYQVACAIVSCKTQENLSCLHSKPNSKPSHVMGETRGTLWSSSANWGCSIKKDLKKTSQNWQTEKIKVWENLEITCWNFKQQNKILFPWFWTSRHCSRVNPLIVKLSYNLQEKWVSVAFKFQREQGFTYPPFSFC